MSEECGDIFNYLKLNLNKKMANIESKSRSKGLIYARIFRIKEQEKKLSNMIINLKKEEQTPEIKKKIENLEFDFHSQQNLRFKHLDEINQLSDKIMNLKKEVITEVEKGFEEYSNCKLKELK